MATRMYVLKLFECHVALNYELTGKTLVEFGHQDLGWCFDEKLVDSLSYVSELEEKYVRDVA